jgi:transposase-like protein
MVEEYRDRPLDAEYPVVWVDALYEKIRESRRVRYMAVIVVKGVNTKGMTQILAVEPMENDSEKTYRGYLPGCGSGASRRSGWWFSDVHAGLEDSLQFYAFTEIDHRKIASSNTVERLNREIRHRSRVVGIFPSIGSYLWLVTTYLIECEEDWQSDGVRSRRSHLPGTKCY